MGTLVRIHVEDATATDARRAMDAAWVDMQRLSDMMNHTSSESAVASVSRNAGIRPVTVPPELMDVLMQATAASRRTDGAFDASIGSIQGWRFDPANPSMPSEADLKTMLPKVNWRSLRLDPARHEAFLEQTGMRLDLGGIAKLYILDRGMEVLRQQGIRHAMIDGGGDLVLSARPGGRPWIIGIRHPRRPHALLGTLSVTEGYVASSGDYERAFIRAGRRFHHILDPRTGMPTDGPQHVTLIGRTLQALNGLSAAILVVGADRGRALIESTEGLEGLIVGRDGEWWMSPGLSSRFQPWADGPSPMPP